LTTTEKLISRCSVVAMALSNGRDVRLVYLSEPNQALADAITRGFTSILGILGWSHRLECEKDSSFTGDQELLWLEARVEFLTAVSAMRTGAIQN